jgi:hypothetical protein
MEELLIVVLQAFLELLVELLLYGGLDIIATLSGSEDKNRWGLMFLFFMLGAVLGALANLVHPRVLLPYEWLRIGNLLLGPLVVGAIAWYWTERRRRRGRKVVPGYHFLFALLFTLAFDVVRFAYGQR